MKVICNSVGSVPGQGTAQFSACNSCSQADPHDISHCEPCTFNKDATCLPVAEKNIITTKDLQDIDLAKDDVPGEMFRQECTVCHKIFSANVKAPLCPSCYI